MKSKICNILLVVVLGVAPSLAQSLTQQASTQFRNAEKAEAALNDKPKSNALARIICASFTVTNASI
jgi:hypothetical protein